MDQFVDFPPIVFWFSQQAQKVWNDVMKYRSASQEYAVIFQDFMMKCLECSIKL